MLSALTCLNPNFAMENFLYSYVYWKTSFLTLLLAGFFNVEFGLGKRFKAWIILNQLDTDSTSNLATKFYIYI